MRTTKLITGALVAGLAAAFVSGAVWVQHADIDWDRYLVSSDLISALGGVAAALCIALAASLVYSGIRRK